MKRFILTCIAIISLSMTAIAQETASELTEATPKLTIDAEARVDYLTDYGFFGKNLNLIIHGEIAPGLTYHFKQELNRLLELRHAFDATDWVYLQYDVKNWTFSAGKMVFAMGGYDYATSPIDNYYSSVFGADLSCYKFGISAKYNFKGNRDHITAQISDSPFTTIGHNLYGYSLQFEHERDWFEAYNSVNAIEYAKHNYLFIAAIGNRFRFGNCILDLDLNWRYANDITYANEDFTLAGKFTYNINDKVRLFTKESYDRNTSDSPANIVVPVGSKIWKAGLGVEYFPIKDLRLHAVLYHVHTDLNGEPADATTFNVGVTWNVHFVRK